MNNKDDKALEFAKKEHGELVHEWMKLCRYAKSDYVERKKSDRDLCVLAILPWVAVLIYALITHKDIFMSVLGIIFFVSLSIYFEFHLRKAVYEHKELMNKIEILQNKIKEYDEFFHSLDN